ncbi:Hypothetical predicted protein [Xyrichtys novacula]|uniref:Uncharacterized protein n=1 Tax=Xyrichtys novacula TaxID=13765 RepID=A0AAV1FEB2_XYRNO|nr:Hypothetical predicted protein [Xyrichtys novacula]
MICVIARKLLQQLFALTVGGPTIVIKHQLAHLQSCINEARQPAAGATGYNHPAAPQRDNGTAVNRYLPTRALATSDEERDFLHAVDLEEKLVYVFDIICCRTAVTLVEYQWIEPVGSASLLRRCDRHRFALSEKCEEVEPAAAAAAELSTCSRQQKENNSSSPTGSKQPFIRSGEQVTTGSSSASRALQEDGQQLTDRVDLGR